MVTFMCGRTTPADRGRTGSFSLTSDMGAVSLVCLGLVLDGDFSLAAGGIFPLAATLKPRRVGRLFRRPGSLESRRRSCERGLRPSTERRRSPQDGQE